MNWLIDTVSAIRTMRSEMQISPAKEIPVVLQSKDADTHDFFEQLQSLLQQLSKSKITLQNDAPITPSASQISGNTTIHIPLAGLIEKNEEISRVEKQIAKISKLLTRGKGQLKNPNYVNNAPKELVDEVKTQVEKWQLEISRYQKHLTVLAKL